MNLVSKAPFYIAIIAFTLLLSACSDSSDEFFSSNSGDSTLNQIVVTPPAETEASSLKMKMSSNPDEVQNVGLDLRGLEKDVSPVVTAGKLLYSEDLKEHIVQSTPLKVNIPLGLAASLDLRYLGAFRALAVGDSSSSYAVGTLGYNDKQDSLFMAGHSHHNAIAEFKIPSRFSKAKNAAGITKAAVLQPYTTILEKKNVGNLATKITGLLTYNENLIVNSEIWYDGGGTNLDNQQIFTNANDLKASSYKGMFQLDGAAQSAGYMGRVPKDLQESLGGEFFTGWASNYSITSRYSQGPSFYIFNPQDLVDADDSAVRKIEATAKMVFPYGTGDLVKGGADYSKEISPIWGPNSRGIYGFIVPNSEIFMVVGSHGGIDGGIGYKIKQDNGKVCHGNCPYKAGDMYNYFWLFDVKNIVEAANPWDVRPISYGKWSHPYDEAGKHRIIGGAYDLNSERLFLTLANAGQVGAYDRPPIILVYKVTNTK